MHTGFKFRDNYWQVEDWLVTLWIMYTKQELSIERIFPDKDTMKPLVEKLSSFYMPHFKPFFVKIVAAFRGMHVLPANIALESYRKVWQTDRQMDGQTTDKVIPMCRYASQATQKSNSIYNYN